MKRPLRNVIGLVSIALLVTGVVPVVQAEGPNDRERFEKLLSAGNYKEAYEGFRSLALNARTEPDRVGTDLKKAIQCLKKLEATRRGRALHRGGRRRSIARTGGCSRRRPRATSTTWNLSSTGSPSSSRTDHAPGRDGTRIWRLERNRSRAVQLLIQGMDRVRSDPDRKAAGLYFLTLADALVDYRERSDLWRFQALTPLDGLGRYTKIPSPILSDPPSPVPVEPDGTPRYYRVPESFEKARNDGERWRWALAQAVELDPGLLNQARSALADFLQRQFDNLTRSDWAAMGGFRDAGPQGSGPYRVRLAGRRRDHRPARRAASGGSSSPMSSIRSRSTGRSPTMARASWVKRPSMS